jgi:hypothetical protein
VVLGAEFIFYEMLGAIGSDTDARIQRQMIYFESKPGSVVDLILRSVSPSERPKAHLSPSVREGDPASFPELLQLERLPVSSFGFLCLGSCDP